MACAPQRFQAGVLCREFCNSIMKNCASTDLCNVMKARFDNTNLDCGLVDTGMISRATCSNYPVQGDCFSGGWRVGGALLVFFCGLVVLLV